MSLFSNFPSEESPYKIGDVVMSLRDLDTTEEWHECNGEYILPKYKELREITPLVYHSRLLELDTVSSITGSDAKATMVVNPNDYTSKIVIQNSNIYCFNSDTQAWDLVDISSFSPYLVRAAWVDGYFCITFMYSKGSAYHGYASKILYSPDGKKWGTHEDSALSGSSAIAMKPFKVGSYYCFCISSAIAYTKDFLIWFTWKETTGASLYSSLYNQPSNKEGQIICFTVGSPVTSEYFYKISETSEGLTVTLFATIEGTSLTDYKYVTVTENYVYIDGSVYNMNGDLLYTQSLGASEGQYYPIGGDYAFAVEKQYTKENQAYLVRFCEDKIETVSGAQWPGYDEVTLYPSSGLNFYPTDGIILNNEDKFMISTYSTSSSPYYVGYGYATLYSYPQLTNFLSVTNYSTSISNQYNKLYPKYYIKQTKEQF